MTTLDTLVARAKIAPTTAPGNQRAALDGCRLVPAIDETACQRETICATYLAGFDTGLSEGKALAWYAFVNGALSGATLALAAAAIGIVCAVAQ